MSFVDPSDFLKGEDRKHVIEFYHIPTGANVEFKAWLTDFSDRFESEWNSEPTYGRMDPIQTFKQTTRTIDIAWEVIAASAEEAESNMADCQKLFRMLYPTYGGRTSNTLQASPLMKLKFVNLIQSVPHAPSRGTSATAEDAGLTGTMAGFSYSPDLDSGFFDVGAGTVFPQTIKLECTFTVLHTHDLGYDDQAKWRGKGATGFPYTGMSDADLEADMMADFDAKEKADYEAMLTSKYGDLENTGTTADKIKEIDAFILGEPGKKS